jgi:hypothetical protein
MSETLKATDGEEVNNVRVRCPDGRTGSVFRPVGNANDRAFEVLDDITGGLRTFRPEDLVRIDLLRDEPASSPEREDPYVLYLEALAVTRSGGRVRGFDGLASVEQAAAIAIAACANIDTPHPIPRARFNRVIASLLDESSEQDPAPEPSLEARLIAAWRASGLRFGQLAIYAVDAYALAGGVSLVGVADTWLAEMCERYVRERR